MESGTQKCVDERDQVEELEAWKAQPSGVVQWPDADEIMQMAFEEGQPSDDASGYYFELEEFDLFIQRLMEEVARLNQPASAGDDEFCDGNCTWLDHHPPCARAAGQSVSAGGVDERAAFEAAMGTVILQEQGKFSLSRAYEEGQPYTFLATKWAWAAWQARAAHSAPSHGEQLRVVLPKPLKRSDAIAERGEYGGAMARGYAAYERQLKRLNPAVIFDETPSAGSQEQGE